MNIAITGATSGIGWETAKVLINKGHNLYFLIRDIDKAKALLSDAGIQDKVSLIQCDLAELSSVKKAADNLKNQLNHLDVLINNAGGTFNKRLETKEGFEMHLIVNHLGHFLLVRSLFDLIKSSKTKVINVSSEAHKAAKLNFDDMNLKNDYGAVRAYGNAKLYNILFTKSLKDRGVTSYSLHPGVIDSSFGDNLNPFFKFLWSLGKPFMKSAREGASTSIYLAISDLSKDKNGEYFKDRKPVSSSSASNNLNNREKLWAKSEEMIKPYF